MKKTLIWAIAAALTAGSLVAQTTVKIEKMPILFGKESIKAQGTVQDQGAQVAVVRSYSQIPNGITSPSALTNVFLQTIAKFPYSYNGLSSIVQTDPALSADNTGGVTAVNGRAEHMATTAGIDASSITGVNGSAAQRSAGVATAMQGVTGQIAIFGAGNVTEAAAVKAEQLLMFGAGTVSKHVGFKGTVPLVFSGTLTNNVGAEFPEQTGGTNNTNVLIGTSTPPSGNYALYSASTRASAFGGPIDNGDGGAKPACSVSTRGYTWFEEGGAGVADTFEVCRKDAADAYAWVALF